MADPEVDLFAGMKKKKKKQVVIDVEEPTSVSLPAPETEAEIEPEATPAALAAEPEAVEEVNTALAAPPNGDQVDGDGADLFADMKKKKKKKKEIPLDLVSFDTSD